MVFPKRLLDFLEEGAHGGTNRRIESGQRLVEQKRARIDHQCAGQCDALPLAAGDVGRTAVRQAFQPDPAEDRGDPLARFRRRRGRAP